MYTSGGILDDILLVLVRYFYGEVEPVRKAAPAPRVFVKFSISTGCINVLGGTRGAK